jgi:hypothetical protein
MVIPFSLDRSLSMALITCSECGRAVSSKAVACVGCGFPISQLADIQYTHPYVAAVPLSAKEIRWRALFFLATMLVGVIWTGLAEHEPTAGRLPVFIGTMLIIGGLSGLIVSLVQSVSSRD